MAIYRGPGGAGDAVADTTNQSAAAVSAASQASGSATAAALSAANASSSATSAASSAATAAAAQAATVNFQQNLQVAANTLSPGASATVSYNSGTTTMTFGIPTGAAGATGATGATGPAGSAATIAVGTVTTGAAGSSASVTNAGTSSAAVFNFTIPRGDTGNTGATGATGPAGLNWLGAYSGGTSYVVDDAVSYNGASYICKLASTGNLPTNTTYWDILAEKGAPGSGSGDVVGPASAVDSRLVAFDGTSGKIIKDSGYSASSFEPADATILKSAAIGVTVQGYDANTAKYNAATANFTGTLQNGGSNVLVASNIGTTVQGYDANTAKYNAATANFTGTLQNGGHTVLTTASDYLDSTDIGVSVQGYDADTAKTDNAQTFTAAQTFRAANAVRSEAASTQDAVVIAGRAGGTSSYAVTLTPTTLSANRTLTLPNASTTVVGTDTSDTLTNKTLTDPAIIGTILEDVYTISDGAAFEIDPGNGSIQLITLGASRTPKATNFAAGEAVTLMVDDGTAYTLTWSDTTFGTSGVVWKTNAGVAPTLNTSGYTVIVLWKVGTQVYGARVGDA